MAKRSEEQAKTDAGIIDEAKKRLQLCIDADDGDRAEALDDLRFTLGGDYQWDDEAVRQRDLDGRPRHTVNTIPATVHQVTGDIRQNRQSIHVHPVDNEADEEVAEVIEGIIRHIEYDSGADAAYDTALEYSAKIGFGYVRLVTEYCDPLSFNQTMKIKRVKNPFTIYTDPSSQEADGSDMRFAFATSKLPREEFERTHPNRDPSCDYMVRGTGDDMNWLGGDFVRITEYYRFEDTNETLVELSDGTTRLATDKTPLPMGVTPTGRTRETVVPKIMWYKLTALEVLEKAEVPFKWIPIFPVYGDETDLDGRTIRSGIVRHAKSPATMYNYWLTSATEEIAMRTKTPFIGAAGQFEGFEEDWANANNRSFAYLEYNPVTVDGSLAPAPQRQAPADVPAGFIAMAGLARDNVKAVTGIYDASLGNRSNETTGVAINARKRQGDIGNYHFTGNFARMIRHLGRTIVSGIPRVIDAPQAIRIMGVDGTSQMKPVNTQEMKQEIGDDGMPRAVLKVTNDLTVGTYDVVVSTGPAYNTLREEAVDSMVAMTQSWPKMMDVAGDKIIRAMDWPGAAEIADRVAKTLPPGLADDDQDEMMVQTPQGPIPAQQAGQLIGQMDQAMEKMSQELEEAQAGITKARLDNEAKIRVAEIQAESGLDKVELQAMVDMILAGINAQQAIITGATAEEATKDNRPAPRAEVIEAQQPITLDVTEPEGGMSEEMPMNGAIQTEEPQPPLMEI